MWGLESLGIPFNPDGSLMVPLWAAAIAAVLVVVLFVLALMRTGLAGTLVFLALIGFGGWVAWSWTEHQNAAERRTLEARLSGLTAVALAPGSALACVNSFNGETIDGACERSLFASPEATAAAVSYTAARLALLSESARFDMGDPGFQEAIETLRIGLEQDRFGLVAHVLATRKNCTAESCDAFALFHDPARVQTNIRENTFETHLARVAPQWTTRPVAVTTDSDSSAARPAQAAAENSTARGTPLPPNYTLPSAASIPPVSIMTPEPPPANAPAQAAAPSTSPQAQPPAGSSQTQPPIPPRRPAQQQQQQRPTPPRQQSERPRQLPPPTRIQ
ncbi:MAG TPA: hypothetical protein VHG27_00530 [Xanthobacteraceae bacterium]|nr:hypothetical protein [Xanthobacteraceae bacterium]